MVNGKEFQTSEEMKYDRSVILNKD